MGRSVRMGMQTSRRRLALACLLVAAFVLKSAVPLLAAFAAHLQGKAVAEICTVYGVDLGTAARAAGHVGAHPTPQMSGDAAGLHVPAMHHASEHAGHAPVDPSAHAHDHCALTGLAACAVFFAALLVSGVRLGAGRVVRRVGRADARVRDASARWLSLRVHAPPLAA